MDEVKMYQSNVLTEARYDVNRIQNFPVSQFSASRFVTWAASLNSSWTIAPAHSLRRKVMTANSWCA